MNDFFTSCFWGWLWSRDFFDLVGKDQDGCSHFYVPSLFSCTDPFVDVAVVGDLIWCASDVMGSIVHIRCNRKFWLQFSARILDDKSRDDSPRS